MEFVSFSGDGSALRQFGRGGRRKEFTGNGKNLSESSPRRPTPQKSRNMFDKRPRSRGGQYSQGAETAREDVRNLKSKGGNSRFRKNCTTP